MLFSVFIFYSWNVLALRRINGSSLEIRKSVVDKIILTLFSLPFAKQPMHRARNIPEIYTVLIRVNI